MLAVVLAVRVAASAAGAAETFPITPAAIGGAKLGLSRAHYKRISGKPVRLDPPAGELDGFAFPKRRPDVYFETGSDAAVAILTWNRSNATSAGIGLGSAAAVRVPRVAALNSPWCG